MVFGGSTVYKMVINEDGSANWTGIFILSVLGLVVFVWRCMFFTPEYWVAVRKRFNRVVRDASGKPVEYDPLKTAPRKPLKRWHWRRRFLKWRRARKGKPGKVKKVTGVRFRFYLINSLHPVNCGDRNSDLNIDEVTLGDYEHKTSIEMNWNVSRDEGCPTKSILRPAETSWKWRSAKDELEALVKSLVRDAVLRKYAQMEEQDDTQNDRLPLLTVEDDLQDVKLELYDKYGVNLAALKYGRRSVSEARRGLEGLLAVTGALNLIATALQGFHKKSSPADESEAEEETPRLEAV